LPVRGLIELAVGNRKEVISRGSTLLAGKFQENRLKYKEV